MQAEIVERVKEAMVASCNDTLEFTDEPAEQLNAEYLFTVNTAKSINRLNGACADPYSIYIEKKTKEFARDCLRPYSRGNPLERGSGQIRRDTPKIDRNGRIDVVVYSDIYNSGYFGKQPICAVEVKGFNPQRKVVIADLKRNIELLRITGNTGNSVLKFCIFAALHSFKKTATEEKACLNIRSVEDRYGRWLSELGDLSDIDPEVSAFTVRKELVGRVIDEGEYLTIDTDAKHHFVGVLVCFAKREI